MYNTEVDALRAALWYAVDVLCTESRAFLTFLYIDVANL